MTVLDGAHRGRRRLLLGGKDPERTELFGATRLRGRTPRPTRRQLYDSRAMHRPDLVLVHEAYAAQAFLGMGTCRLPRGTREPDALRRRPPRPTCRRCPLRPLAPGRRPTRGVELRRDLDPGHGAEHLRRCRRLADDRALLDAVDPAPAGGVLPGPLPRHRLRPGDRLPGLPLRHRRHATVRPRVDVGDPAGERSGARATGRAQAVGADCRGAGRRRERACRTASRASEPSPRCGATR